MTVNNFLKVCQSLGRIQKSSQLLNDNSTCGHGARRGAHRRAEMFSYLVVDYESLGVCIWSKYDVRNSVDTNSRKSAKQIQRVASVSRSTDAAASVGGNLCELVHCSIYKH